MPSLILALVRTKDERRRREEERHRWERKHFFIFILGIIVVVEMLSRGTEVGDRPLKSKWWWVRLKENIS